MESEEADSWIPPKTSEEEAIERSRKTAVLDTKRWIEETCDKKFADESDFRGSLRNGILLCEVLNKLKPGCVKRINRRPTPIAGLDNLSVFLAALEKDFGFSKAQLFDVKDLEDISEKYQGDAFAVEDLTRALRVALTLCGLSQQNVTSDISGPSVKPIDSTLFISGTVIHRRQSLALSNDSDSLAGSGYLASSMPVRHNYDIAAGTSFDSLDDSRASSAASGTVGGGPVRFQKRDAADLAREAERQMEVARMNRTLASTMRPSESNEDEWRSNLSDWREKRRRQNQTYGRAPSLDQMEPAPKKEESVPENPKPFKKMVEESNKRRRSYNLLYPVEDEDPVVYNIDIPDSASTVKPKEETSSRAMPSSVSYPESAAWATSEPEQPIAAQRTSTVRSTPPVNSVTSRWTERESNGTSNKRDSRTSETSSSDGEVLQRSAAGRQRTTTIRLTRRQGHRVEQQFGIKLSAEKGGSIVVERVVRGSTADINEVRAGDKVVSIDGRPVSSLDDATQRLNRDSAQLCVERNSQDDDEFTDEMSDDESVEMRHPVRRELSNRRSAPCMSNKEVANEPSRVSDGPPANLPPLRRRVSSSSSTSAGALPHEEPGGSELHHLSSGSLQDTPMINGLLNAARKGELPLDLRSRDECSEGEDANLTPTASDHANIGDVSPKPILSVRQRITTIESRNNFFGVKADSEEKKYKELEQTSSRPVSGDETSLERPSASQALPWQRKQEFRPIRPRLGHYQKPQNDEPETKKSTESSAASDGEVSDNAAQLMVGMTKMRDDMAKWRQRQETNEAEIESVLSVARSGGASSSSSRRSRDSGDETLTAGQINVREQAVIDPERQDELGSSPSTTDYPSAPPVRDSRARNAHQQPSTDFVRPQIFDAAQVEAGSSPPDSSATARALAGHAEAVELEIQKLEKIQIETNKPVRSTYESSRQSSRPESNVHTKSPEVEIARRIDSNGGSASNINEYPEEESDIEEKKALRQPYLQKYLAGEHFKSQSPSQPTEIRRSISRESTEDTQPRASQKASLSATLPSYEDVRSRHSPRNRGDVSGTSRPKSLITDQPSTAKHSSEFTSYVRPSTSDTQLVSSAQAPQQAVPHYHQRPVDVEQVIKPSYRQQIQVQKTPAADDYEKPARSGVMSRSYEVPAQSHQTHQYTSSQQQKYPQEPPMYDAQQQRYTSQHQQYPAHHPAVQNEHYNQIYNDEPPIRYHSSQQQISPKGYEASPSMSTSMYDFNRPPNHMTVMTHSTDDGTALHSNLSRSQASLSYHNPSVVQQQRHTIQRTAPATSSAQPAGRMPNSHSVDSGLFQIRAQTQAAAVSNPVYGGPIVHEPKRSHGHSASQRHWLVDEALRRQQAEHEARRQQAEFEAQRRQQAEHEAQRRQQAEIEAQRRQQAELEAQRRQQAELEAQRRQQAELEARRQQAELDARRQQAELEAQRRQQAEHEARRQQAELEAQRRRRVHEPMVTPHHQSQQRHQPPHHYQFPPTSEPPPALPPRIKSSVAAMAMQRPRPVLNSRAPCTACNQPLGTGDLMTIESLHLSFHLTCFRCIACQTMLGSGRQDADVRVRGSRLYCFNCSALEEGTGVGGGLGRRGGGRY